MTVEEVIREGENHALEGARVKDYQELVVGKTVHGIKFWGQTTAYIVPADVMRELLDAKA